MPPETVLNAAEVPGPDAERAERHRRAHARAVRVVDDVGRGFRGVWLFVRFLCFILYLVVSFVSFWFWAFRLVVSFAHLLLRMVAAALLWLSGGVPPPADCPPGTPLPVRVWRHACAEYPIAYEAAARDVAWGYLRLRRTVVTWWHWHIAQKVAAALFLVIFVVIPGMYVVPRPHYVQVTDDNAIHYEDNQKVMYLVHGLDMFDEGVHREYMNEDAWWFGKINSQGLKSQLQIGHYYRLWVVGIRWYWKPRLFPNIISATEVDEKGNALDRESSRIAAPAAPPTGPAQTPQ